MSELNIWGYEMVLCPICSNIMEDYEFEKPEQVWNEVCNKHKYGLRCTMCHFKLAHIDCVDDSN